MPRDQAGGKRKVYYQKWCEDQFWGSNTVRAMNGKEALLYRALCQLAYSFGQEGLPNSLSTISALTRLPLRFVSAFIRPSLDQFHSRNGRLFHPRIEADLKAAGAYSEESPDGFRSKKPETPEIHPIVRERDIDRSLGCARAREAPETGEKQGVSTRETWKTKTEALASARLVIMKKRRAGKSGEYLELLIIRNALDCWYRRESKRIQSPVRTFHGRVSRGKVRLKEFGEKRHPEAVDVKKRWEEKR